MNHLHELHNHLDSNHNQNNYSYIHHNLLLLLNYKLLLYANHYKLNLLNTRKNLHKYLDYNSLWIAILDDIINGVWGRGDGATCLDFCCGSGVGSHVLRTLGFSPLSCDNDAALLSLGFSNKRLMPEETICIDATIASQYIEEVPLGVGMMMGDINAFTQDLWQLLVTELFSLTDKTLITVGKQSEADLIRTWGEAQNRTVEVCENPKDPTYDRWVCAARQK
jgi:hypothetical protein